MGRFSRNRGLWLALAVGGVLACCVCAAIGAFLFVPTTGSPISAIAQRTLVCFASIIEA